MSGEDELLEQVLERYMEDYGGSGYDALTLLDFVARFLFQKRRELAAMPRDERPEALLKFFRHWPRESADGRDDLRRLYMLLVGSHLPR